MDEGFFEEALETFLVASTVRRAHEDWDNAAWWEHTGAIWLKELGRFEEALDLLARCRQIFVDMGNLNAIAETDGASFACLEAMGRDEEALVKLRTARSIFQEIGAYTDASLYGEIERTVRRRIGS